MKLKLQISSDLALPTKVITSRMAFLGTSDSGKTYGAKVVAERMLDIGAQVGAIDMTGTAWWGLRASASGKRGGYPVTIFGGVHGDVPIVATAGHLVADVIVDTGISFILDVSDFTLSEMYRFVGDFAERLFERKQRKPGAMHVFWEEAHTFLPQERLEKGPEFNRMMHRVERVIRVARNYGVGNSMISQFPQGVRKQSLNLSEVAFVMRMGGKHERKYVTDWLSTRGTDGDALFDKLKGFETGTAFISSPYLMKFSGVVKLGRLRSFDSSATPEFGKRKREPKKLASVEVERLKLAMKEIVDEVEGKDVDALKRRIAGLEKELAAATEEALGQGCGETIVEVPVLKERELKRLEKALADAKAVVASLEGALRSAPAHPLAHGPGVRVADVHLSREAAASIPYSRPAAQPAPRKFATMEHAEGGPTTYTLQLLETLRRHAPLHLTGSQWAILAGRSHRSSTFVNALAECKKNSWVHGDRHGFHLTDAGLGLTESVAGQPKASPVDAWRQALPDYELKLFDALRNIQRPMSREGLAEQASVSPNSSTFSTALSTLRKNGLFVLDAGMIALAPELRA